ncbi:GHKL domain-containing protein [Ruminococcaceae bacterium OttesenSCG-928-A11]|nr:GHKL domain-containing protein [Ruminococcaceae bacterium OttesenSCG-928-A11]
MLLAILDHVSGALWGIWLMYVFYYYATIFFERKKGWKTGWIILSVVLTGVVKNQVGVLLDEGLPFFSFVRPFLSLLLAYSLYAVILLSFQGSVRKKAVICLFFFIPMFASEMLGVWLVTSIYQKSLDDAASDPSLFVQTVILSGILLFLFVVAIRVGARRFRLVNTADRPYPLELSIPVLSMVGASHLLQYDFAVFLYAGVFLLAINGMTLLAYNQRERYYRQNQQYALERQHDRFREEHYRDLEAHQAEIRAIRHDLKNQLIAMNAYVEAGSAERAQAQISALIDQLSENERFSFAEHAGLNGLLSATYRQAQQAGARCDFTIDLPAEVGMADADLVALVGNILDNALEACRHCQDTAYIRLEMARRGNTLLLRCENSTDGKAPTLDTRKEDRVNHGIGMGTIQRIVEKHHGELQYRFAADHFVLEFTLFLVLNTDGQPA